MSRGESRNRGGHRSRDGVDHVARSRSRRRALQAVYAMQLSGADVKNVIAQFAHEQAHEVADLEYFEDLVRGVDQHRNALDQALAPFLDRGIEEVDPIERAMLRIAAYELQHRIDVPYRVVIDEAVKTVKRFGSEHGHTYVNGVLDHAANQWRAIEANAARGS
ncbi:transcription antitermination factor NusB [Luteimonas aquatica]|uniref:transcription antitermination factor NusB n=1 Tax=Luteimonas aquatica TaxID=450364 RepID=UPI001F586F43|nr:transcription antitermination factor NusB [Luteimonas aquatica]